MNNDLTYAKEIFNQLKYLGGTLLWNWGASAFKIFHGGHFNKDMNHMGGLIFKVRGMLHNGHVMIRLAGNDTYTISIGRLYRGEFETKKQFTNIYFDQMVRLIDGNIELKNEYFQEEEQAA